MKTLMIQGTTSDAGKSVITAGLCRVLSRKGVSVVPFKPQNMALNSAVTEDGGEIGRAQAVQAQACGLPPHTDMNPILIKPSSDTGAQIIVHGKPFHNMQAGEFHDYKKQAMQAVLTSYHRLASQYDVMMVEGAGSPAEINLRENDIANMGFAEAVDCPVIIVADIDRGGVFAHLVGTLDLLSESEQNRVMGFVINRFRGDISLLQSGIDWLEARTGKPVLGVLPYLHQLHIDAEDAIASEQADSKEDQGKLNVVVPVVSRISNHTDFDALRYHPQVDLRFVEMAEESIQADLIILPGTKNTLADLQLLKDHGWQEKLDRHLRYGGKVLGVCGGYQMLGLTVEDPDAVESQLSKEKGFGYLQMQTCIHPEKQLKQRSGLLKGLSCTSTIKGYEIHCGESQLFNDHAPFIEFENGDHDGVVSDDEQIIGTYLHGLFDDPEAFKALLHWAGLSFVKASQDMQAYLDTQIDRMADCIETHMDMNAIMESLRA